MNAGRMPRRCFPYRKRLPERFLVLGKRKPRFFHATEDGCNMKYRYQRMKDRVASLLIFSVFACLAITLIASLSGISVPHRTLVMQVLLGGFIGGITNTIAITMLFEKKWFLPGSGVLLKKHKEIIRSLARTAETHLLNSEMLQAEMQKLLKPVNADKVEEIINNVIDEFRDDVREYLRSQEVHDEIRDALKTKLGFLGSFLNITRIKEYDEMTDAIVGELQERIERLRVSNQMVHRSIQKVGTLEEFLFKPNNEIVFRHYHTDKSIAQLFFDNLDIQGMVADKLATYAPSRVRDIIEENIRSHLLWLEVFGVLLGMLFAAILYFVMRSVSLPM
jgi:uncharacterized membrane protein YheB (UPF0754 family)